MNGSWPSFERFSEVSGRLCIIGVGLIGGSVALAARQKGLFAEIIGVDQDSENLREAQQRGVINGGFEDVTDLRGNFDVVMLATPVGGMQRLFELLKPRWSSSTVYTDVGSTKENVVEAAKHVFGSVPSNFIAGHPIAGSEKSGIGAARADLYQAKRVILTPCAETSAGPLQDVRDLWEQIGAMVSIMEAHHHDQIFAATSHLPHIVAFALVDMLGRKDEQDEILKYAAGGFRDFTRIASSNPRMWLDICMGNRKELMSLIEGFKDELSRINEMLENCERDKLLDSFQFARDTRQRFLERFDVD